MRTVSSGWADQAVRLAVAALEPAADPKRAAGMAGYLRDQFPFLGISAPQRRGLLRLAWSELPAPVPDELAGALAACWRLPQREYQYAGCDLLERWVGSTRRAGACPAGFVVEVVEPLLVTKAWWDTVDALRSVVVGPMVQAHPDLVAVVRRWVELDDRWLVRSALIHQLGYRERTDEPLLLELCARRASDREFFVAKGLGWALRTHARLRPETVRQFCADHPELTRLARREALKHLAAG